MLTHNALVRLWIILVLSLIKLVRAGVSSIIGLLSTVIISVSSTSINILSLLPLD